MGCVSTPLWVIFQICVPSPCTGPRAVIESSTISVGGSTKFCSTKVCCRAGRIGQLEPELAAHAPVLVVGRAHLVVEGLRLEGQGQRRAGHGLELHRPVLDARPGPRAGQLIGKVVL